MALPRDIVDTRMRAAQREADGYIQWLGESLPRERVERINGAVAEMLRNKDLGVDDLMRSVQDVTRILREDRISTPLFIYPYASRVTDDDVIAWFIRGARGFRSHVTLYVDDFAELLDMVSENTRELFWVFKNFFQAYEELREKVDETGRDLHRYVTSFTSERAVASVINTLPPSTVTEGYVLYCNRQASTSDRLARDAFNEMVDLVRRALAMENHLLVEMGVIRERGIHEDYVHRAGLSRDECGRLQAFIARYGGGNMRRRVAE